MGKTKIKTHASREAMRWADDGHPCEVVREPTFHGNDFDVKMQDEPDGALATKKIVDIIKERGVALIQANAPQELVMAAQDDAEHLWSEGLFVPPMRVHDDRSMMERQLWQSALQDDDKVFWVSKDDTNDQTKALKILSENIQQFAGGLSQCLSQELGVNFDRFGRSMLSCYTGDRTYSLHLDNCHGAEDDDRSLPDNGMRVTLVYYINMYWNPIKLYNGGGLDVHLSDPLEAPSSASVKSAKVLRIAPHADTLAVFLSDRIAHRVIQTTGDEKRFCLTMWCLHGDSMQQGLKRLIQMRQSDEKDEDDED
mmetsp:Transcript_52352/g.147416  ORF Transcript_52352/g.147416 Transcript_52352/m.147416 type:complete len:310 (+) Transcript_52352:64-993(+)